MRNFNTVIRSALLGFAIQGIGLSGWFFCNIMDMRTSGSFLGAVFMWPGHLTHRGGFQSVTISLSHALLFAFFTYIIQLWSNERISRVLDSIFLRSSIYGFSVLFVLVLCDFIFASGMPALSYFHPILILGYCTGLPIVMAISVFCEGVILSLLFARRISHMTRAGAIISTPATAQPTVGCLLREVGSATLLAEEKKMKFILRHPIWNGIAFEGLLVMLFCIFPAGACNSPPVGVAVIFAHYPALVFVERVLHIGFSAEQAILSAALMIPVWILVFALLKWFFVRVAVSTAGQPTDKPNEAPSRRLS